MVKRRRQKLPRLLIAKKASLRLWNEKIEFFNFSFGETFELFFPFLRLPTLEMAKKFSPFARRKESLSAVVVFDFHEISTRILTSLLSIFTSHRRIPCQNAEGWDFITPPQLAILPTPGTSCKRNFLMSVTRELYVSMHGRRTRKGGSFYDIPLSYFYSSSFSACFFYDIIT